MMDFRNATMERDRFVVESASIPKDLPWGVNATGPVLALAGAELSARIAEARVDMPDAIASWRDAVALQDAIPYDEPPDWYYPIRESLDGAMLRAGHYAQAELVFREDLRRNPRNPRSLFGLL